MVECEVIKAGGVYELEGNYYKAVPEESVAGCNGCDFLDPKEEECLASNLLDCAASNVIFKGVDPLHEVLIKVKEGS